MKEDEETESGRKLNSIVEKFYNYWHSKENVKTLMKEKEDILSLATNPRFNSRLEFANAKKMFEYLRGSSREHGDMLSEPRVKMFLNRMSAARRGMFDEFATNKDSQIEFDEGSLLKLFLGMLCPKAAQGSGMRSHDFDPHLCFDLYDDGDYDPDYDDYEDNEDDDDIDLSEGEQLVRLCKRKTITNVSETWNTAAAPEENDDERENVWSKEELMKQSRKFNIDLTPRLLFSRGHMVELLISSNISRYTEFKSVTR